MSDSQGIGGYFELPLNQYNTIYHDDAYQFQSARAAFRSLLQAIKPKRVYIPKYTCDAMLTPLLDENVAFTWYDLDLNLGLSDDIKLKDNEYILYVNYFGLCDHHVDKVLQKFSQSQVILDYSQAFFSKKREGVLATIYSPRKFFAVPDGGMLLTNIDIPLPDNQDIASFDRMPHLLKRTYAFPEDGYVDYLRAESSLDDCIPLKMSDLTERLLQSVDYEKVKKIRQDNFLFLKNELEAYNAFNFSDKEDIFPLCYPLIAQSNDLKEFLIAKRVFVPTYWQDAIPRVKKTWANEMIDKLVPLPIDQRYGFSEMSELVRLIKEYEHG